MRAGIDLNNAMGLTESKELTHILYKMVSVFKFRPMLSDELGTQLVKNLTYLLKTAVTHEDIKSHIHLQKLFGRCSFVARKMMLNVSEAKDRIAHVLLFFQVSLHLFETTVDDVAQIAEGEEENVLVKRDNELSRAVVHPILELVYRIYTDD